VGGIDLSGGGGDLPGVVASIQGERGNNLLLLEF
jgi:hypothetical protein